jgi:hypothetical protein
VPAETRQQLNPPLNILQPVSLVFKPAQLQALLLLLLPVVSRTAM